MGCYDETLAFLRSHRRRRSRAVAEPGCQVPMIDRARPRQRAGAAGAAVAAALARRRAGVGCARVGASDCRCCGSVALRSARRRPLQRPPLRPAWHRDGSRLVGAARAGAAAVRAVLGAARAGRAQPVDRSGGGARTSSRVLERDVRPDPAAAALVLPAVPLDELYAEPARAWLEAARPRRARQRAGAAS